MPFPLPFLERIAACALLVIVLPTLLPIALLIHQIEASPVVVTDELPSRDGTTVRHCLRFRTTGRGASFFHIFGRYLRATSLDEAPALWSVVCGDMKLRDLLR